MSPLLANEPKTDYSPEVIINSDCFKCSTLVYLLMTITVVCDRNIQNFLYLFSLSSKRTYPNFELLFVRRRILLGSPTLLLHVLCLCERERKGVLETQGIQGVLRLQPCILVSNKYPDTIWSAISLR